MNKIRILWVEDEQVLTMVVKETLETRGFEVNVAGNGVEGWSSFRQNRPDVCIIDIMMPRKDGLSLVADIRQVDELIPIILVTAKIQQADVLRGLEAGADDYMKKPFSMEELILRLKSLCRRELRKTDPGFADDQRAVPIGSYIFNYDRLELIFQEETMILSQREAELMRLLIRHKNGLLERRTALIKIWEDDNISNSRSMDVYVTRLRKFLNHDASLAIQNIRGYGYKLTER